MTGSCAGCGAPAVACQECVRAIALQWFGGIARHPDTGTDCRLCEQGAAVYCGNCFVTETAGYRTALRQTSIPIGEPDRLRYR